MARGTSALTWFSTALAYTLMVLAGCPDPSHELPPPATDPPGSQAWGDEDITCEGSGDCLPGEICLDGICQVDRCSSGLQPSAAPIGEALTFFEDSELAIADEVPYEGEFWVDGYGPTLAGGLDYDHSWSAGLDEIVDIAGGNLLGSRPERYVAAVEGMWAVALLDGQSVHWIDLDLEPVAVAAGDTDGDGVDEIVAISAATEMAICEAVAETCQYWDFSEDLTQIDVAVGDVDADSIEEPVVLLEYEGTKILYVTNVDADETGQVGSYQAAVDGDRFRVTAADLDGDRAAEVVTLDDAGWWGLFDDGISAYRAAVTDEDGVLTMAFEGTFDGVSDVVDLGSADTDGDGRAVVAVVTGGGEALVVDADATSFGTAYAYELSPTVTPRRVAMADHDGDAPRARLVSGPESCHGAPVPVMLLTLPPYDEQYSDGESKAMYGEADNTSESHTDTVSLGLQIDVGAKASFLEVFAVQMSTTVKWKLSHSVGTTTSTSIGARYSLEADPDTFGPHYGGIVLSWGCFDAYTYAVDDPGHHLGGTDGEEFVLVVPTGGGQSLWSTPRYNALAEALGTLPVVDIPYDVGIVETYPTAPETLDGEPIPASEMVFPEPQTQLVSDVGKIEWRNKVGEDVTNSAAMSMGIGASAGILVGGVKVGGGASIGWGQAYSLKVGESAMFAGSIPPLPDDVETPEDEYALYAYSVTPWVYLQHYTDADGEDAAFYVETYTVEY